MVEERMTMNMHSAGGTLIPGSCFPNGGML